MTTTIIEPTPARLGRVLTSLNKAQLHRLVRVVLGLDSKDAEKESLNAGWQLRAYVYEWLLHLGFLSDDQARRLLDTMSADLMAYGGNVTRDYWRVARGGLPPPPMIVTVADRRYVGWTGRDLWSDVYDETSIDEMAEPAVTTISCNVLALFLKKQRWLHRLEGEDDQPEHHAEEGERRTDA